MARLFILPSKEKLGIVGDLVGYEPFVDRQRGILGFAFKSGPKAGQVEPLFGEDALRLVASAEEVSSLSTDITIIVEFRIFGIVSCSTTRRFKAPSRGLGVYPQFESVPASSALDIANVRGEFFEFGNTTRAGGHYFFTPSPSSQN